MKFAKSIKRPARAAFAVSALALLLAGCDDRREVRQIMYTANMHFSPAHKAQERDDLDLVGTGAAMRVPPAGTVGRDYVPYTISNAEADALAMGVPNPVEPTPLNIALGQRNYNIHCLPCHGVKGNGYGPVITRGAGMPIPPSLYSDKLVNEWTDGRIYHVITMGQGQMRSYAASVTPEQRWQIIHYIRALQVAARPTEGQVEEGHDFILQRRAEARGVNTAQAVPENLELQVEADHVVPTEDEEASSQH